MSLQISFCFMTKVHKYLYICIYIHSTMGFLGGSDGRESACSEGDPGLIPGLGRSPGG